MINLECYVILSTTLFLIGCMGIYINKNHLISILMSIELMLLAVNINMVAFSFFNQSMTGYVFALFVLSIAAAESAIGLALIVLFYKHYSSVSID